MRSTSGFGMGMKTDLAFGRKWGLKHLPEGSKNGLESGVVALFHLVNFATQILVSGEHRADLEEGAHNGDIYVNGAIAVKNTGEHGDAVLCEKAGEIAIATPAAVIV